MTQTVLITGCSSGLGKAAAKLFAGQGWNVVATMRDPDKETELNQLDGVFVTRLDVEIRSSIDAAIEAGIARFGRIDALINNAGFGLFGVFEGTSREKIREQFDVNVFGVMNVTRAILPHFRANKGGLIINVSSGAGAYAYPMISLYAATKFALEGFSEALSYELASQNIAVKIIEPGGVLSTNFFKRSLDEATNGTAPADYNDFVARTFKQFEALSQERGRGTEEGVAQVIFDAATDGSDQLRYVATDDIVPLIAMRREKSEKEYMAFMRARFQPDV